MISITKEPEISVGILKDKKINFELYGEYKTEGYQKPVSGRFTAELTPDNKILCKRNDEVFAEAGELFFAPVDFANESFLIRDVIIGVQFHWERKEKERFTGSLKLIIENGDITAVNVLPIEKYLVSVISSEMSAKCSLQLLKAHSIVSRSWLLANIEKSKVIKKSEESTARTYSTENELIKWYDREDHLLYDVCADDHCQRYQGITKIFTDIAKKAAAETAGVVLTYDDQICDARYSKSCGGISEGFENVWEPCKLNYLSAIVDYKFEPENYDQDFSVEENAVKWISGNPSAFCNTTDEKILAQILPDFDQETKDIYRWTVEYSQDELAQIVKDRSGIDFGQIVDLIPVERGNSARLIKLKIVGTKKTLTIGKELEIRRTLSRSHLYSSAFYVEKENVVDGIPGKIILHGAGWGHGVGLCQIGAAVMAESGYMFDEILLHYFKDAELKKIY